MEPRFSTEYYNDVIYKAYEIENWYMPYSRVFITKRTYPTPRDMDGMIRWIQIVSNALDINPKVIIKRNFSFFYDMCKWILDRYYDRASQIYISKVRKFRNDWLKILFLRFEVEGFSKEHIAKCFDRWVQNRFKSRFIWSVLTIRIMLHEESVDALHINFEFIEMFQNLLKRYT